MADLNMNKAVPQPWYKQIELEPVHLLAVLVLLLTVVVGVLTYRVYMLQVVHKDDVNMVFARLNASGDQPLNYNLLYDRLLVDLKAGQITDGPVTGVDVARRLVNLDTVDEEQVKRLARDQFAYYWKQHDAVARKRGWKNVITWKDINK